MNRKTFFATAFGSLFAGVLTSHLLKAEVPEPRPLWPPRVSPMSSEALDGINRRRMALTIKDKMEAVGMNQRFELIHVAEKNFVYDMSVLLKHYRKNGFIHEYKVTSHAENNGYVLVGVVYVRYLASDAGYTQYNMRLSWEGVKFGDVCE